jgi:hypothetical protein
LQRYTTDVAMRILMESAYTKRTAAAVGNAVEHDDGSGGDAAAPVECARLKNRKIITNRGNVTQSGGALQVESS